VNEKNLEETFKVPLRKILELIREFIDLQKRLENSSEKHINQFFD
jgi:hypothetical protein